MSLDITFQKTFTISDIKNNTTLDVRYENNNYWLCKDDSIALIKLYDGVDSAICGITSYGVNSISDIMDILVITFQTKFITDNEEEELVHDNSIDIDKLFYDTTISYGYNIENNIISK